MNENSLQSTHADDKMYFHLVLADVVFETKRGGVTSHRTQFITQSKVCEFPAARIHQLQNSAALTVRNKLEPKDAIGFQTHDVLLMAITPCGYMTTNEFYAGVGESEAEQPKAEPAPTNVIPFDQPN
jgi:hypothetical protein